MIHSFCLHITRICACELRNQASTTSNTYRWNNKFCLHNTELCECQLYDEKMFLAWILIYWHRHHILISSCSDAGLEFCSPYKFHNPLYPLTSGFRSSSTTGVQYYSCRSIMRCWDRWSTVCRTIWLEIHKHSRLVCSGWIWKHTMKKIKVN